MDLRKRLGHRTNPAHETASYSRRGEKEGGKEVPLIFDQGGNGFGEVRYCHLARLLGGRVAESWGRAGVDIVAPECGGFDDNVLWGTGGSA